MKNGLYIVATPIGNLQDISTRALEVLKTAEIIACEDTRMTKKLFGLLNISLQKTFITLHDHNEAAQAQKLIDLITEGKTVALVSDAGSPLISDPGYKLIRQCQAAGVYITAVPGCCALICALQLSGLPTDKFMFTGFIPNKDKARYDLFASLKNIPATIIFYETAPRIIKTLQAAREIFGDRETAVVREITKMYEQSLRGTPQELITHFENEVPKGEMVFMVAPAPADDISEADIEDLLRPRLKMMPLKTAVKEVVETFGLNKNEVYQIALRLKNDQ